MGVVDSSVLGALRESLGDEAIVDRVIGLYLGELDARMDAIRAAIATNDAEATREAAHSLRGSSATLGATRVAQLTEQMETSARAGDLAPAPELLGALEPAAGETATALRAELSDDARDS